MSSLGVELLGGAVVAFAVGWMEQRNQEAMERQRLRYEAAEQQRLRQEEAAEQQRLQVTLGLHKDLSGITLARTNLSGFYLRGKILKGADLTGADPLQDDPHRGGSLLGESQRGEPHWGASTGGRSTVRAGLDLPLVLGQLASRSVNRPVPAHSLSPGQLVANRAQGRPEATEHGFDIPRLLGELRGRGREQQLCEIDADRLFDRLAGPNGLTAQTSTFGLPAVIGAVGNATRLPPAQVRALATCFTAERLCLLMWAAVGGCAATPGSFGK